QALHRDLSADLYRLLARIVGSAWGWSARDICDRYQCHGSYRCERRAERPYRTGPAFQELDRFSLPQAYAKTNSQRPAAQARRQLEIAFREDPQCPPKHYRSERGRCPSRHPSIEAAVPNRVKRQLAEIVNLRQGIVDRKPQIPRPFGGK